MKLLVGCFLLHVLAVQVITAVWWVPDLTVIGLMASIGRMPRRWLLYAGTAGVLSGLWSPRLQAPLLAGYLLCGALLRLLAGRWDLSDGRVQSVGAVIASGALAAGMGWSLETWSWRVAALSGLHAALTGAAVVLVHLAVRPATRVSP